MEVKGLCRLGFCELRALSSAPYYYLVTIAASLLSLVWLRHTGFVAQLCFGMNGLDVNLNLILAVQVCKPKFAIGRVGSTRIRTVGVAVEA